MLQLEELETRFSEFDEFVEELTTKREEVYEAFSSKKQALVETSQRRAQNLLGAADRILANVSRRAETFESADDLNAYFAVGRNGGQKLRSTATRLRELKDTVHADELERRAQVREGRRGSRAA